MGIFIRRIACLAGFVTILSVGGIVGFYSGVQHSDGLVTLAAAKESSEVAGSASANSAESQDQAAANPACLDCHGPFEELIAKPPTIKTDENGLINPHRYVPHKTKDAPDCTRCHQPHPIPPTEPVKKPTSIQWCYDACHHQQNFTPCVTCHPNRAED